VIEPLSPPSPVTAEGRAEGIRLSWAARAGITYRLFRGNDFLAESARGEYLDQFIDFGKTYSYQVTAAVNQGDTRAESLPGAAVTVDYQDRFAPATPTGLTAIAGVNSIEIAWDRNTEPDLAGYRIYRAEGEGPFAPLGELVTAPSYGDRTAAKGKTYRYAVTALDRNGNESPRQPEAVSVEVP
jgi:fibronectin type 3 domain-containing protein